ncbi:Prophage LambdaBa04, site-specific recombinase, phage integrase family protein [Parageobacillus genomosp. 1]|uniref:Prophage LambdaBa04, site-specific recombinase, phage integrase family protein n=1 Tax=Parageobacillus genomosp. 1 TaxID=1295642 RepID=A0ABC9VGD7_9BACL|nr:tyrosine-type recombinase/integrase [Parageobacillus genomosp. 1]EZP77569.1 Prophage LambdaBa04, site-specific recombinase, phage integrase family protein [Parageobacillus genomosp. 1]
MKGYFRKRGDKWSFTVDIGKDPITGKRRQKTVSGFKTKKEAQAACAELIAKIEKEGYIEPARLTLAEFAENVIKGEIEPNYRPNTTHIYIQTLRLIKETIGHIELSKLNALHIQHFVKYLREKGLKNGTIKLHISKLKRILRFATKWKLITYDLAAAIEMPKTTEKNMKYWTFDECMKFLEKTKNEQYYLVFLLTIFTGLRRGEVLGIPIHNVDFENNTIKIDQQITVVNGKARIEKVLKSESSHRVIDVPSDIMHQLKRHIHEKKKLFFELGIQNKHNLVFTTSKGTPIYPGNVSARFRKLCKELGMKPIPFHGLRHSHATMLAEMKENVHAIAERLGHSSTTITNEMYIHLTNKMKSSLSEKLEAIYNETMKNHG